MFLHLKLFALEVKEIHASLEWQHCLKSQKHKAPANACQDTIFMLKVAELQPLSGSITKTSHATLQHSMRP